MTVKKKKRADWRRGTKVALAAFALALYWPWTWPAIVMLILLAVL